LGLFELLKGYDDDLVHEFSMELHSQEEESSTTVIIRLDISLNPETIRRVTILCLGITWSKHDKQVSVTNKKIFFLSKEKHVEDKNGVRR